MKRLIAASILTVVLLSGCSKSPIDKSFDLTTLSTLTDSSNKIAEELTPEQTEAVSWAIDTLGIRNVESLDTFKQQFGQKVSYRNILQKAIDHRKDTVFEEYDRLKSIEKDWMAMYEDLSKIKATNITLGTSKEFFTSGKPLVSFDVHNGSQQDLSLIIWDVDLYLDDDDTPYSSHIEVDSYKYGKDNGLRAGETVRRSFVIDDFGLRNQTKKWNDLTARNAKKKTIVLTVRPTSAEDFSEEKFITGDVAKELQNYAAEKTMIENAEKILNL